ncbi:MAG TPA: CARDB domain-containing protein, partial [Ignavibacteriales bacterium]|nr:CARDB domain-containing protein [Ignavibacteriales bacterium]
CQSLDAAFSDTLLIVSVDTLQDGWYRYSAPLGSYAGQQIYIGFKEYNKSGCGVYLDDISFGASFAKDIAYARPSLTKYQTIGESRTINVYYVNRGHQTESFDVACEIPAAGYSSSKTINNLAPGSSNYVTFSWTPSNIGQYQVTVRSTLAGDEYAGNDAYIDTVNVVNALNPAVWTYRETGRAQSLTSLSAASYIKKTGNPAQPFEGGIYILGGRTPDGSFYSDSIYFYDMNTRKWSAKNAVFPAPISMIRTAQVKGKIYIPGGSLHGIGISSSLYIYDIESDVITQGADMLEAASGYALGVYKDSLIYVMGGPNNKVQIYNINTNSWAYGTSMLYHRSNAGGSIAGNKIVAAGGYNAGTFESLSSAEIGVIDPGNPYQITWTLDEYPAGKVSGISSGSWYAKNKEYIFFTGGWRTETYGSSIIGETWAYDVQNDKWLSCPGKLPGDSFSDMVPVYRNDSVYIAVLGGSIPSYFGTFNNEWMYIGEYDDPLSAYNKDIAAVSAVQPDTIIANSPALFGASFKNRQLTTQTFDVKMVVAPGGYTGVKTVNSLAYKETSGNIAFDPWTPAVGGDYTVKIFPVIEGDEDASNDTLTLNIYAQKVDVVAKRIKNDVALYPKVKTTPTAYFANAGDLPETFNVTMEIAQASYASVKSVSNLAPGDTAIVAFEDWTPDSSGNYAVKIYSSLPDDENKVDDTLLVNLHVQKVDAAVSRSLFETPVFAMTATIPKAYLVNYGEQNQTFSVVMKISESSYASVKTVEDLPAGDSVLVLFDNWNPAVSGTYHAGIYISPSIFNDEDKANDTLRTSIFVEKTDNSSTKISIASLPYSGKIIIPKASFENRGTHSQTFMVSMSIAP